MIDCTKTENYFAEKLKLTKKQKLNDGTYICKLECADCPLGIENNGADVPCSNFEMLYPKKAIAIIQAWSDEHLPKTYLSEFLKNYPNTPLGNNGTPESICPYELELMSIDDCRNDLDCVKCWNQPIEESESK